jgi:hypothetical protein
MKIHITDKDGKPLFVAVAKTSRGFNARQKRELQRIRDAIRQE